MPRENRKRGKRHKKTQDEDGPAQEEWRTQPNEEQQQQAGPSWIVAGENGTHGHGGEVNLEAPFGYVDADVKAYFRTVDNQIKEWQENGAELDADPDVDPNENRRMFLLASLQEMTGKEKELATDPDCSGILERMIYSMDDFVRRVFLDSLAGSFEQLVKHRFASHVVQTLLDVGANTISREARGVVAVVEGSEDKGELRSFTQLVLDMVEELLPSFATLLMDPFASHVFRSLFVLLSPQLFPADSNKLQSQVRSKKSASWKAKQGPMKSLFNDDKETGKADAGLGKAWPVEFRDAAKSFVQRLRQDLGENEVRSLAANKVASPVLQMLLEIEADNGMADEPDSLMDRVLVGLITLQHENPDATPEVSDFLGTLLRDATSSHLLETLVSRSPPPVFDMLWDTYFAGKLARLAAHPVANFVVAKAIERVSAAQMAQVLSELGDALPKIRSSRTGVLRALVERAAAMHAMENEVCETICAAFELATPDDRKLLVPCVLRLKTLQEYNDAVAAAAKKAATAQPEEPAEPSKRRYRKDTDEDPLEPKVAGALLLQSLLRLPDPHNQLVLSSIQSLPMPDLLTIAHHATSSRVLDAVLDASSVPPKAKRTLIMAFIGHYPELVDDRIGSRVGDRCWAAADPYLKEKIARSLIPHETRLAGSFYGKFFARNLNLYLLQRRPEEWRSLHAKAPAPAPAPKSAAPKAQAQTKPAEEVVPTEKEKEKKEKAKRKRGDEIDDLFDQTLGKKVKRAALASTAAASEPAPADEEEVAKPSKEEKKKRKGEKGKVRDDGLGDVLGAIKAAPKGEEPKRKKHKS
ncbi:ARM repeat-containing protein [Dentipellis sp. KUC8613]|nr:ARM repeat-containing protein [Dentipellis sp. KUC8613]